jgi:hypothetical protein
MKEWTLMFYFASDNPLAPGVVSQLKALKNAGYHHGANVVTYFDPQTPGTPTHTFDVNAIEKLEDPKNKIGFTGFTANDPFVRNLMRDKLWGYELSRDGKPIRDLLIQQLASKLKFNPPMPPDFRGVPAKAGKQSKKQKGGEKSEDHGHRSP